MGDAIDRTCAGLCAECVHARLLTSDKGSVFIQCELAKADERFAKYPRLPVLSCSGYVRAEQKHADGSRDDDRGTT